MKRGRKTLLVGIALIAVFALWTVLIQLVDVHPIGVNGTDIGFATFNSWFHEITGANMLLYVITDWLRLVPIIICMMFEGSFSNI